jgi:transcriptional regulator with XRE-family HTH domain
MGNRYSSAAYRELGGMLRRIREQAGLSSGELAHRLGWPLTTVSRMERGWRTSSTIDVIQYVAMCGMKAPDVGPILEFTRLAERRQGYYLSDWRIGGTLQSLIFHESLADHSIIYEPHLIHGLLQIPAYARARILSLNSVIAEETVAGGVRTRTERRQVLYRPNPPQFTFYLGEQALRFQVGSDEIMHEQLLHLVLTAALENVAVRVVPNDVGAFDEPFRLMEFQEHPPIVYLDNLRFGGLILEDVDHVNSYCELVSVLADVALGEGQSREFVAALADEYDRGSQQGVSDVLAQEQLQQRHRNRLRGGGLAQEQLQWRHGDRLRGGRVAEPPTAIYE